MTPCRIAKVPTALTPEQAKCLLELAADFQKRANPTGLDTWDFVDILEILARTAETEWDAGWLVFAGTPVTVKQMFNDEQTAGTRGQLLPTPAGPPCLQPNVPRLPRALHEGMEEDSSPVGRSAAQGKLSGVHEDIREAGQAGSDGVRPMRSDESSSPSPRLLEAARRDMALSSPSPGGSQELIGFAILCFGPSMKQGDVEGHIVAFHVRPGTPLDVAPQVVEVMKAHARTVGARRIMAGTQRNVRRAFKRLGAHPIGVMYELPLGEREPQWHSSPASYQS